MATNIIPFPAHRVTPVAANDNDLPPIPAQAVRSAAA